MMHKISGNVLHWLIMPVMLLGVIIGMELPVNAANTDGTVLTEALVREVGGSYYYNLQPGTWYIDDDVDLEYGILVEYGTVTINLNGHTLNYAGFYDNSVIYVTGGNLTVNNGTITGGKGNNEIHNKGNINAERRGGGFAVAGNDTVVTINHVTIRDNQANWGGGLFLDNCSCCVTLNHSTVTNNIVQEDWGNGGGVFFDGGTLVLNNSQITENRSESGTWAGVSVGEGCKSLQLSGNSRIYDNIDDERQENLHIGGEVGAYGSFQGVSVTGVLGEDALFGVTMTSPGLFTTSENTTFNDPGRFVSDASDNAVAYKVKYISNESASLTEDQQKKNGQLILASDSKVSVSGYTGWYDETDHGIDVSYNGAETITYGTTEGKCDQEESPTYIERGLYTVYYQVQTGAEDGVYALISGCATVNIQAKATFKAGSDDEPDEEKGVTVGRPYTLPECEDFYSDPPNDSPKGTVFAGWKSEADDKVYAAGDSVILNYDTTFTAQWETGVKADFVDRYENNWDSSESITVIKGTVIKLPKLSSFDSDDPKCFVKWSDGTNTYDQGAKYTLTKNTIFTTVQVEGVKPTYYYNSEESESGTKVIPGTKIRLPQLNEEPLYLYEEPEGKFFAGWNDGQKTYQAGTMYLLTEDTSFHAVWLDGYVINNSEDNTANLNGKEVGDSVLVRDDYLDGKLRIIIPEGKTIRITGTVSTEEGSFFISCGEDEPSDTLASFSGGKQTVDVTTDKSPVYLVLSDAQDPDVELTVTITSALHTHSFSYAVGTGANANTITATCSVTGCPNDYGENGLKLTLSATGGTYDGNAKAATVSGYPEVPPDNLAAEPTTITYYKSTGVDSTTTSGNALSGAPTDAGSYVAQLTWGGQTASKAFTIAKCSVILTTPTAKTLTYNGQPQELITVGIVEGGSIEYAVTTENKEPAADEYIFNNTSIPTGTDAGTYYVWYRVKGDSNHNDTEPLCIPVTIENASMSVSSEGYTGIYDAQAHGITVTAPEGATVNYRTTDSGAYDLTDNPTYTDAGTYTVYYQVTKANYTAVSGSETITINKKDVTVSGITADSKTYDRSTSATINTSGASFAGLLSGDTLTVSATGTFDDMNVGAGKTVTIGNLAIGGTSARNYKLAENGQQAATTADITAKALTVTAEAKTKVYGTNDPELTYIQDGLISGDSFTGALTRAEGSDVGTYAIAQGTLTAGDNYAITYTGANLTITQATPVITGISANDLTYDKTEQALVTTGSTTGGTLKYAMTAKNAEAPDDDSYIDSVPTAIYAGTYTVYYKVVGNHNYLDVDPAYVDVTIAQKEITISGITAEDKIYNKATDATLVYSEIDWISCGMVEGDNLTISAVGTFSDINAEANKTVTISNLELGGDTITEYKLAATGQQTSTTAAIEKKVVGLEWHIGEAVFGDGDTPTFIYNGTAQAPSAVAIGLIGDDSCEVTVTGAATNANAKSNTESYTATASELSNPNYALPEDTTKAFVIDPINIRTDEKVSFNLGGTDGHYTYTGEVIAPEIVVSRIFVENEDATVLVKDDDYTMLSDTSAIATGQHYIKFNGIGNYAGTVYKPWYIDKMTVTVTADNIAKIYGDADPELAATITGGDDAAADEIEYTVSRTEGEDVGTYTITVTGEAEQGDYNVVYAPGTFTINKANVTVTAENKSKTYGDEDPELTAKVTGLKNGDSESLITYNISRADGEDAGGDGYVITPTGESTQGNYNVSYVTGKLTIKKRRLTADFVGLDKVSFQYDGNNHFPQVVFSKYMPVTHTVSGETTANDKGRHTITVNGTGTNFTGSIAFSWYITGVGDRKVIYDGQPHTITVDDAENAVLYKREKTDADYTLEAPPEYTAAGSYTIYYKTTVENPMHGYIPDEPDTLDIEGTAVITITKAPLTVTAENKSKVYGDNDPELTYVVSGIIDGETVSDALTGNLTRAVGENVGSYSITKGTLAATDNYEIAAFTPATLTITLKPLNIACFDVKFGSENLNKSTILYNGTSCAVTVTAAEDIEGLGTITPRYFKVDGETETETYPSGTAPTEVGKYRVRLEVAAGTNYSGTGSEVENLITDDDWWFEIIKAPFPDNTEDANWPTVKGGLEYSGADQELLNAPATALTGYTMKYRKGNGEWGTALPTGSDAGEYTIYAKYVSDEPEHNSDSEIRPYTVSIGKATINVTADAKNKTYGEADPTFTYTVSGLVAGDTEEIVVTGALSRAVGENVGNYTIGKGSLSAGNNYTISYTGANLTIGKKTLTVTADAKTKTYGNADPVFTYTAEGFAYEDSIATVMSGALSRAEGSDVGTYAITQGTLSAGDNYDISYTGANLTVTKRNVTLTSATASKAYDGTALTNAEITVSGDGFADGEGAEYNVTGTQTLPGNSVNGFTYTLKTGTNADNYTITKSEGTLTVTGRTDEGTDRKYEINVEANSTEVTYDGTEHTVNGLVTNEFTINGVTYTVSGLSATASGTDAGDYVSQITGIAVVKDQADNVLTDQFIVNTTDGSLKINKRNVTLTSATDSKTYDGTALTNDEIVVSGDGFVAGSETVAAEGATYSVTGSQKVVGSSANSFTYTLNTGTKADNYNITTVAGTLTVTSRDSKYEISPQANSGEVKYDGKEHQVSGFVTDTFVVEGNTYKVSGLTASVKGTDAGTYTVSVSGTAVVKDSDGADVSDEFSVTPQTGTLTITKRSVTMTSATDSKEYDGDALTNDNVTISGDGFVTGEGAEYTVTGTRTVAGTSENGFTYTLNTNTKADNYDITTSYGTLTVTNRNTKYNVTLKADSNTEKYDGTAKTVTTYTIDGKAGDTFTASNGKTYTISGMKAEATGTDAGTYTVNVTGTPTIKDSANEDVTAQFAVSVESGTLTINKRSVTLTSDTASKAYDGKALKAEKVTVSGDGFVEGESASYTFTGSQTLPGESDNTFTYALVGAKADNYNITTVNGKLTVNERNGEGDDSKYKITVKAKSGTFTYDGNVHTVTGFETLEFTVGGVTYTVSGISATGSLTDAGETEVVITGTPKVKDADGNDLTGNFDVECENGKLTVVKAAQEKPEDLSFRKASSDTSKDGVIIGLDEKKLYEYSEDDGTTWTKVKEGSTEVTGIGAGDVIIRYQENNNKMPSDTIKIVIETKEDQAAPSKDDFTITNASEEDAADGVITGVDDTMEYSLDGGKNWIPVEEDQTEIDNLPVGDVEIRLKGDEDKNPSESLKVSIGVTSRTQGVVNFKTDDSTTPVETSVESAKSSNIEEYAKTQVEEGKDVKIELEITPRKEEDVTETSVTEIAKVSSEVFASIEAEDVETEYLEIDLAKYVDNTKEGNISDTGTPLEIELNYDASKIGTPVVIRTHKGKAKVFEKLNKKPNDKFVDATYYVDNGRIYLYSQFFSDFALVYATKKTYYVSIDTGVGDPIVQVVGEDSKIELPTGLTKEGYGFGGWYKDSEYQSVWDSDKDKVNEDTKIYGKWDKKVTGVSVAADTVNLTKTGQTSQIKVTVSPSDAANKNVTYKSSNTKVATVDGNGKITAVANGTATITVTTADGAKTATVKVTVAIPEVSKQGTGETVTPAQVEKNALAMNEGLKIDQKGSKINIRWGRVEDADGYEVYVAYCGTNFNKKKPAKTIKNNKTVSATITKINGKKLNLKKNYKLYVTAYKLVDGKKVTLAKTITGHIVGRKNVAYTNVKDIKITKSKYTISVGKTAKIKAKTVLVDKSKKQLSDAHAKEFRYASSNKKIATVDKNGKIKGVKAGTTTIYVYARNGYAKTVKVTVK